MKTFDICFTRPRPRFLGPPIGGPSAFGGTSYASRLRRSRLASLARLGAYDYMGSLSAPLTLSPGGYIVLREGGPSGKQTQQFGKNVTPSQQALRAAFGRRTLGQLRAPGA